MRTESVELGPFIMALELKKITAASPDQCASMIELGLAIARLADGTIRVTPSRADIIPINITTELLLLLLLPVMRLVFCN